MICQVEIVNENEDDQSDSDGGNKLCEYSTV